VIVATLSLAPLLAACGGSDATTAASGESNGALSPAELPAESRWSAPSWPATPVTGLDLRRTGDALGGRLTYSGLYFQGDGRVEGRKIVLALHPAGDRRQPATAFEATLEPSGRLKARVNGGAAKGGYDVELVRAP
jgi:hypothetical protein